MKTIMIEFDGNLYRAYEFKLIHNYLGASDSIENLLKITFNSPETDMESKVETDKIISELTEVFTDLRDYFASEATNSQNEAGKIISDYFASETINPQKSKTTNSQDEADQPIIEVTIRGNQVTATCNGQGVTVGEDHSTNQYLNTIYALKLLKQYPKIGDVYYYIDFNANLTKGKIAEIRKANLNQSHIDYYKKHGKLPINVYQSMSQASDAMHKLTEVFTDLRGKWDFDELD